MEQTSKISSEISELFKQHAATAGDWCDVVDGDIRDNKISEIEDPRPSEASNCFSSKSQPIFVPAKRESEHEHVRESEPNGFAVSVWSVPREATEEELFYYFGGDDNVIIALKLHMDQPGETVTGQVVFNSKEACDRACQMNGKKFFGRPIRVASRKPPNYNSGQPAPPVVSSYKNGYGYGSNSGHGQGQQNTFGRGPNTSSGQFQGKSRYGRQQQQQQPMNMPPRNGPSVGQQRYGYATKPSFDYGNSSMRRQPFDQHQAMRPPVNYSRNMPNEAAHVRGPPPDAPPVATGPPAPKPNVFGGAKPVDTAAKLAEISKRQEEKEKLTKHYPHGHQHHNADRESQRSRTFSDRSNISQSSQPFSHSHKRQGRDSQQFTHSQQVDGTRPEQHHQPRTSRDPPPFKPSKKPSKKVEILKNPDQNPHPFSPSKKVEILKNPDQNKQIAPEREKAEDKDDVRTPEHVSTFSQSAHIEKCVNSEGVRRMTKKGRVRK